jgi:hypothetical protein
MVVFSKHMPQQAVFSPKPLAEVKETSNLGEVRLPEQKVWLEQKVWVVIPKVTPAFSLGKVELSEEAEEILRTLIQGLRQALKERKNLVVLSTQQPKHSPVSPHLPPEEVDYIAPMVPPEGTHTVADNPLLESARASTKAALEQLVKEGYITGFEEWGCLDEEDDLEEGDALYFVAYAKSPRSVERRLAELSSRLTRAHRVPIFIVTFKDA